MRAAAARELEMIPVSPCRMSAARRSIAAWQCRPAIYVCLHTQTWSAKRVNMYRVRYLKIAVLGLAALLAQVWAWADSACVSNGAGLQNAMLQWLLIDSGTMTIKLVKVTYTLSSSGEFSQ